MTENFGTAMKLISKSNKEAMEDRVDLDSAFAKEIGFTSDKFEGYLWKKEKWITISFIMSKQQGSGNLSKLFRAINEKGYKIAVPAPFPNMQLILICHGFKRTFVNDSLMGKVPLWKQQLVPYQRDVATIRKLLSVSVDANCKDGEK